MDLRQFRYFIQAARRENFRKASEDLRIAQSALTRQIQLLEHELGFLFTVHCLRPILEDLRHIDPQCGRQVVLVVLLLRNDLAQFL